MAVPFSNTRLRVPKGFQNVLEGLAREVLRCQPENIYSFAADYFEELLRKRQETGYDDLALLGAKLDDRFYNNHCFKNHNTNRNNEEQQSAAVIIQSEFRRHAAKKEVDSMKEEKAAIIIQASVRGHLERQSVRSNSDIHLQDKNINQETVSEINQLTKDESFIITEEENREPSNEPEKSLAHNIDDAVDIDLNDPEVEKAALKIQSVYKGFRTRKTIEETAGVVTHSIPHPNTEDLSLEKVTERDHTSDREETAVNEIADDEDLLMSKRTNESSLLIENNDELKESGDFSEMLNEGVVEIESELKLPSPGTGNPESDEISGDREKSEADKEERIESRISSEGKRVEVNEDEDGDIKTDNDMNTRESTEMNLDTENEENLQYTERITERSLVEGEENEIGHVGQEEVEKESESLEKQDEEIEDSKEEITTERTAEEEKEEEVEEGKEVTEEGDEIKEEEGTESSETKREENIEEDSKSERKDEVDETTTGNVENEEHGEEDGEETVESQEVTLNETDAEAVVDTERAVDTTNDLEDTIVDNQEESNESVLNPDHDENQNQSMVDEEEGETFETSRTEATEGEND